jgi:hypothetical protein
MGNGTVWPELLGVTASLWLRTVCRVCWFEFRPSHQLSSLIFAEVFLSPSRQMPGYCLNYVTLFFSSNLSISSFDAIM